jgi:pilus assembly protein Flp/PilA
MLTVATPPPGIDHPTRDGKEVIHVYLYQRLLSFFDRTFIARVRSDDDGQGLAEYALILALVAIIAIVSLIFLGSQVSDKLHIVGTTLENVK